MPSVFGKQTATMTDWRSYTWEGRCYTSQYGNRDLLNFYVVTNPGSLKQTISQLRTKLGSTLVAITDKYYDCVGEDSNGKDIKVPHVTFIVDESHGELIKEILHHLGFIEN